MGRAYSSHRDTTISYKILVGKPYDKIPLWGKSGK